MHENFRDLATRLISKNGRVCQIVSITNSGTSFNPDQTEILVDIIAVNTRLNHNEIDGDLVRRDDLMFLIDSQVKPTVQDKFIDQDVSYQIKNISEIKPADTSILYKIQVRK